MSTLLVQIAIAALFAVSPADVPEVPVVPGEGVSLAPNPSSDGHTSGVTASQPVGNAGAGHHAVPLSVQAGMAAAALGAGYRRRDDPIVVVVHGDGGSPESFDPLLDRLGIPDDRVVAFDYSTVDGSRSSTHASHFVSTAEAAAALDDLIRGLSAENSNIYSIHHSRGGAVGVEMIANLDEGARPPIDGYRGAALLDPAIAAGGLGDIQSAGGGDGLLAALVPDDGGFDPIRCSDSGCRDIRVNLGERAGVEVIAIRNPDAVLTNFDDEPEGLRVFDLTDPAPSAATLALMSPVLAWARMRDAHGSVLTNELTAECIAAEIGELGSCTAFGTGAGAGSPVLMFGGAGRNLLR